MPAAHRPLALIILDGWGYNENSEFNAIAQAETPVWDRLWRTCPHTFLHASGLPVGLPDGQMGNSEVGHLNLGAGRVVYQEFTRITRAIETGEFFENPVLTSAVDKAEGCGHAIHVFGLLSSGGVHSHEEHIAAMLKLAADSEVERIYLHAFLDGRDTPPKSAGPSLQRMQDLFAKLGKGRIATVSGRYYAMDRDNRWDRVEKAYRAIAEGCADHSAPDALIALEQAYSRGENDEFVLPTLIVPPGEAPVEVEHGDVIVFMNFRADRAREITRAFTENGFTGFVRGRSPAPGAYICLTQYHKDFTLPVAFPPESLDNLFGEWIAERGLRQLRIAETEKYAHVTFFFNGGRENAYKNEERTLINSPKVATYDLEPEMSAHEVTDKLIAAAKRKTKPFDVIICNFANSDMVGHTGMFDAALTAVETLDTCLGRVVDAVLARGGELLVTADHGNIEKMCDVQTGQAHTAHTTNLVPFIYVGNRQVTMSGNTGALADVAPTMLRLLNLPQPAEMTGQPLLDVMAEA